MSVTGWDEDNARQRKLLCDVDGVLRTKPEGVYLSAPDNLAEGEQQRLRLTIDGKLMVDDPTTQAAVAAVVTLLESGAHGLAALKLLIDAVEGKLDVPANFMADVSGLATAANLAVVAGYLDTEIAAILAGVGAIPTTPELEASASTRYDALIAAIGAIAGGVDWSALTPKLIASETISSTYVNIVNVEGAGYLTGIGTGSSKGGATSLSFVKVVIDDITLSDNAWTRGHDADQVYGIGIGFIHRFETSLLVQHKATDAAVAYIACSYVLE